MAEIGHLTESLVGRDVLVRVLNAIHADLTPEYMYKHFTVRIMNLDKASIGFWVTIPKLTDDEYVLWRLTSVPFLHKGSVQRLKIGSSEVGISINS